MTIRLPHHSLGSSQSYTLQILESLPADRQDGERVERRKGGGVDDRGGQPRVRCQLGEPGHGARAFWGFFGIDLIAHVFWFLAKIGTQLCEFVKKIELNSPNDEILINVRYFLRGIF